MCAAWLNVWSHAGVTWIYSSFECVKDILVIKSWFPILSNFFYVVIVQYKRVANHRANLSNKRYKKDNENSLLLT